jgi:RNA polymerase sigma-70 factor, ECF subfamily
MTVDAPLPVPPFNADSTTEQELIQRIHDGDVRAYRQLYDRYAPLVYEYIRFRVSTNEDAEDLTADVFISAIQALPKFEWKGIPIAGWLLRIAHNRVVDAYRKQSRFSISQWLPWKSAKVEKQYHQIEQQDVIRRAFETLSYEQQVIVYLAFFENYSHQEIAEIVGKSASNIGVIKFRALKQMGKALKGVEFEGF